MGCGLGGGPGLAWPSPGQAGPALPSLALPGPARPGPPGPAILTLHFAEFFGYKSTENPSD